MLHLNLDLIFLISKSKAYQNVEQACGQRHFHLEALIHTIINVQLGYHLAEALHWYQLHHLHFHL